MPRRLLPSGRCRAAMSIPQIARIRICALAALCVCVAGAAGVAPAGARVGPTAAVAGAGSFPAVADAWVAARANFGRGKSLVVRARPATRAFLEFDLRSAAAADPHLVLQLWARGRGA